MTIQEAVELSFRHDARLGLTIDKEDGGFYGFAATMVLSYDSRDFEIFHQTERIPYERVSSWQVDLQLRERRA